MRARSSMVERFSYKEKGVGSSPTVPTKGTWRSGSASRPFYGRLAQWLERSLDVRKVTGSNPVSPTIIDNSRTYFKRKSCFSLRAKRAQV